MAARTRTGTRWNLAALITVLVPAAATREPLVRTACVSSMTLLARGMRAKIDESGTMMTVMPADVRVLEKESLGRFSSSSSSRGPGLVELESCFPVKRL